ncbi:hypothetical protein LSCM4_07690 [Leishmania orientalis]|uniref:Uncharacterized protein n=1 Tax=Leishmania orientalis TaxID=2249476 RepID=A0A836GMV9_9TRYP|nr:hypothetical protein LSCM4_07690 [Leishmania orientalis]
MPQPSSRGRTGEASRPPAGHSAIPTAVPQEHFPDDFETPPPPSRRLRSRSSQAGSTHSPPSLSRSNRHGIDLDSVQPHLRPRPVTQRQTTAPMGKARAAAVVAPQTSRVRSSNEVRYRREHISERQPGSRSAGATAPRRPRGRSVSGGAASARPLPITNTLPVASQSSLRLSSVSFTSEVDDLKTHHALRSPLGGTEYSTGQALLHYNPTEVVPASVAPYTPLDAEEEVAASTPTVALADSTPMTGGASGTASCALPRSLNSMHSLCMLTSPEATPTMMAAAPLLKSVAILGPRSTTFSSLEDEQHTVEDPSMLHQPSRPVATHEVPVSVASSWSPPMPPIDMHKRSIPSVASNTGSSHCSTLTEAAATPRTGSCQTWSTAGSATDLCGCSPTAHAQSFSSALRSAPAPSLIMSNGAHHHQGGAAPAPRGAQSDGGVPSFAKTHPPGNRLLSHSPIVASTCSTAVEPSPHVVPEATHTVHAPEQHRQRPALPLPAPVVRSSISSRRASPSSTVAYSVSARSPLPREGTAGGSVTRTTLLGYGDSVLVSCSPHPTRPPRANPSGTPRRMTKSSERNESLTPMLTASVPGNCAALPPTKSPAETLAEELARRALKDRRRRELYAWNELLRSQDECNVQDAV